MGEIMDKRISVLDVEIDGITAKEAMRSAMEYIALEQVNVIEFVTAASLMRIQEEEGLREEVCRFDLVLAGGAGSGGSIGAQVLFRDREPCVLKNVPAIPP